ncbi:DUF2946 family protein [Denitratisoma oestradiolicum]|uniref:DUF2946 domain-containing protein n=1 Tax=Denitratisoma oestradiolicum TaxID=311182 RepID=A0A6S6XY85_9PROT|nr:DUF2946 family protein [Denitratisoma oestradiolicum]TWO80174.1 hypothetical protein CBW56_11460 [Denitratisoma oestradiolicum]CAB1369978.1 conserved protein of unknown function [Denitratisoma oestradiolicum]
MDDAVLAAMARWPNVPNVYDWLSLDQRGRWRIKGEVVGNQALAQFIGRNYEVDARGCWYFQNGPQRVFVTLEYTPWVLYLTAPGRLETHTGLPVEAPGSVYLDNEGNLLLDTGRGLGLICDRDLAELIEYLRRPDGSGVEIDALEELLLGRIPLLHLHGFGPFLPVSPILRADVARIGGHVTHPSP